MNNYSYNYSDNLKNNLKLIPEFYISDKTFQNIIINLRLIIKMFYVGF